MVETFTVEEICQIFYFVPWNLMFFFSHFIWPSMGDLEVEHVTVSVKIVTEEGNCGTVLWKLSLGNL